MPVPSWIEWVGVKPEYGEAEHEDGGDDEEGVASHQTDQQRVDGALHLRPAEDDDGDHVAQKSEHPDAVDQDPVDDELKRDVERPLTAVRRVDDVRRL